MNITDKNFDDFRTDNSEAGTVQVKAPPGNDPKEYTTQLWIALKKEINDTLEDVKDRSFVRCVYSKNNVFYLELKNFKARVRGDTKVYADDRKAYEKDNILACDAWGEDGKVVGSGHGADGLPGKLIYIPRRLVKGMPPPDPDEEQKEIWQRIARSAKNTSGSGRLWKSHGGITPVLQIYFAPVDPSITKDDLATTIKSISAGEKNKPLIQRLESWANFNPLSEKEYDDRQNDTKLPKLVRISANLLQLYATYMTSDDIDRLIQEQTKGRAVVAGWMRRDPEKKVAEAFNALMEQRKDHKEYPFNGKLEEGNKIKEIRLTAAPPAVSREQAPAQQMIMGNQSANKWALDVWKDTGSAMAAEWLHRAAYSLGNKDIAYVQSSANFVFGTYEANSDMTRAEAMIRRVLDDIETEKVTATATATGTLTTEVVNSDSFEVVGAGGKATSITICPWMKTSNYSWLSPELKYNVRFDVQSLAKIHLYGNTQFHTFSCYTPLSVEGRLDRLMWDTYFKKTFARGTKRSSSSKDKGAKKLAVGDASLSASPVTFTLLSSPFTGTAFLVAAAPSGTIVPATTSMPITTVPVPDPKSVQISSASATGTSGLLNPAVASPSVASSSSRQDVVSSSSSAPSSLDHPILSSSSLGSFSPSPTSVPVSDSGPPKAKVLDSRDYSRHPLHQKAWDAAFQQKDKAQLGDVTVTRPHVLQEDGHVGGKPSPTEANTPLPASGFILTGEIELFGIAGLTAKLKSWHGPPPPHVKVGSELPLYQHAEVSKISVSDFIPLLAGTPFKDFELQTVTFTYQNYPFEESKSIGWSVSAEVVINTHHGMLHTLLTEVLGLPKDSLTIEVSAWLGLGQSWSSLPSVSSFSLEGVLKFHEPTGSTVYKGLRLCDGVSLTRVGVRLFGVRSLGLGIGGTTKMSYGFSIFGELNVAVPASKNPVAFDFEISEFGGQAQLDAYVKGDIWKNAFGSGINLESVKLSVSFSPSAPLKSLTFAIEAFLNADSASAFLAGSYTPGGDYSLSAKIHDFGVDGVVDLFRHYADDELALPTHANITIGSAGIKFSKAQGLAITIDQVKFESYTAASAELKLSSNGVLLRGAINDVDFHAFDFKLINASILASFEKVGSGRSTDVALHGKVQIVTSPSLPEIEAAVHFYKGPGDTSLQWTVYGSFVGLGTTPSLGTLIETFKNTFLENLTLQELTFIAASKDDPVLHSLNPQKFVVHQGVQICAALGTIDSFHKLLRRQTPGLTLNVGWSKMSGFSFDVVAPADTMIHLGRGITTDPIELKITMDPVQLTIDAGVKVPVPKSPTPLDFRVFFGIDDKADVTLEGTMHGSWRDPFGISDNVTVGPDLGLSIEINLPDFFVSGIPKSFGFMGNLEIGHTTCIMDVKINEDPTQELLEGNLVNLGIQDIVSFAREITGINFPTPPDFLDFKTLSLYISTGVTIGTIVFPEGFSFEADLEVFNHALKASAAVTNSTFIAKGSIDKLKVGPLQIEGHDGGDAILDLEIGAATQKLTIDGIIRILDIDVALLLDLEILPTPKFKFDFVLHFTPLLTFGVDAQMRESVTDLKNLGSLDFDLRAHFEQHVLDYVHDQVVAALERVKKEVAQDIKTAKAKVDEEKKKLDDDISKARTALDKDYQTWFEHSTKIHEESAKVVQDYETELKFLQSRVDSERVAFNLKLTGARGAVQHANAVRAEKMREAEAAVTNAKATWDRDAMDKEKNLEEAKVTFNQQFGRVEEDIDHARAKLNSIVNAINEVESMLNGYRDAHWYEFWNMAAIPVLDNDLVALKVSKAVALGVLRDCEAVVNGVNYVAVKGAIPAAEVVLEDFRKAGDRAFNLAKAALKVVDKDTAEAVSAAEKILEEVQKGGDALWRSAETALDVFVETSKGSLVRAQKALDDLVRSSEWLAYKAASAALDLAQHATHALDVAKAALDFVEKNAAVILKLSEDVVTKASTGLDITKIELTASLQAFLGTGGKKFTASIEGTVVGKSFKFDDIELDLSDTAKFIHAIFVSVLKKLGINVN